MAQSYEGKVVSCEGDFARVEIKMHASCSDCGACQSPELLVLAYNSLDALPRQQVVVTMSEKGMLKTAFILFVLPLAFLFLGAYLGWIFANTFHVNTRFFMVGGSFLFVGISLILIKLYDNYSCTAVNEQTQIVKVLD